MSLRFLRSVVFVSAACFALASAAAAAEFPTRISTPSFADALRAGGYTIPAAWAGVWAGTSIDYDCATNAVVGGDSDPDTLCTGDDVSPGDFGFAFNCSGTIDDNSANVTCTADSSISICSLHFEFTLVATRSGDSFTATTTISQDFNPDFCGTDSCVRTETTATRIAPEPAECATPVDVISWGEIKSRYR